MVLQFFIHLLNIIILKLNNIWLKLYNIWLQLYSVSFQVCGGFLRTSFSLQDKGPSHLPYGHFVHAVPLWLQESHEVPDDTTLGFFTSHL